MTDPTSDEHIDVTTADGATLRVRKPERIDEIPGEILKAYLDKHPNATTPGRGRSAEVDAIRAAFLAGVPLTGNRAARRASKKGGRS